MFTIGKPDPIEQEREQKMVKFGAMLTVGVIIGVTLIVVVGAFFIARLFV